MDKVKIENISKKYDGVKAVDDVTASFSLGEITTLIGPSGCGKTTTLRCIAGLEKPDQGEIWIGDDLVFSAKKRIWVPPHKRPLSMVFQSYAIWPHMTVFDNIAYGLKIMKRPQNEIKTEVMKIIELLGLKGLEDRNATALSGGQQQRVALARCLVLKPEVILLDEPLSNLDAKLRAQMRTELRQLLQQFKLTAIYVTHDQEESLSISDKIYVMHQGKIVAHGNPLQLYSKPPDVWVADFLGKANVIDARVDSISGKFCILETAFGQIKSYYSKTLKSKSNVALMIRLESIKIFDKIEERTENTFEGKIGRAIYLGSHFEYEVLLGENTLRVRAIDIYKEGQTVFVYLPPEKIHIFE